MNVFLLFNASFRLCWSLQQQWMFEQVPWILAFVQTWSNLLVVQGAGSWDHHHWAKKAPSMCPETPCNVDPAALEADTACEAPCPSRSDI